MVFLNLSQQILGNFSQQILGHCFALDQDHFFRNPLSIIIVNFSDI
jgi:hypothetical protein